MPHAHGLQAWILSREQSEDAFAPDFHESKFDEVLNHGGEKLID